MSFQSWLGHWRRLEVPKWGLSSWSLFGYFNLSLLHPCSELWLSILILKVLRTFKSFMSYFGALEDIKVPDWGFSLWSWFGYGPQSLTTDDPKFGSILVLKVQRTSMSFKSWFVALEDAGDSWLGFSILVLIWIWSLDFDKLMFRSLALNIDLRVQRTFMSFKS